jgi:hypothetical protein
VSRRFVSIAIASLAACSTPVTPDAPASPWRLFATLPVPRLEPGVTALGDQLVVLGGFDTSLTAGLHITTRVDVLDTLATPPQWRSLPDAPVAWTHVQLAAIGTTLYLLGGLEGQQFIAHGEAFALDTLVTPLVWRPLAPMPAGLERGSAAVIVAPPRIYLLGGASTTAALASNIFYDTELNQWCPGPACTAADQFPDLPQPRSHPAAMRRVDGSLVVTGGLATLDSTSAASDTWLLAPLDQHASGMWQTKTPMPTARGGCAYGTLQGQLVCAGGEAGTSALTVVESYDAIDDVWSTLAPMPVPRAGTLGAAIGQQLYVPGGAERLAFEPTDTVYVFSPLDVAPH